MITEPENYHNVIFSYIPKIDYNNIKSLNLLLEVEVIKNYLDDYTKFYTYVVSEGERPDILAHRIYNDSKLDWVLYLINGVNDPYSDWVMDSRHFKSYLESKYNMSAEKLTSTTNPDTIVYYYYKGLNSDSEETIKSFNYNMSPTTYAKMGSPAGWVAKSIYDYENEINESKREIKVLKPVYIPFLKQQIKDLFNA